MSDVADPPSDAPEPRAALPSATVIVLRPHPEDACEVLLVERHGASRAFAGAYVFPGGLVDPTDAAPDLIAASLLARDAAAARFRDGTAPDTALPFWIAAIRELFEETGLLLASRVGSVLSFVDRELGARFRTHRHALLAGSVSFDAIIAAEKLTLATDQLELWSRWITPVNAPRRYDARFFVTRDPVGQEPEPDARETTACVWLRPAEALARARDGTLLLAPPTLRTLEDLDALRTIERILVEARRRTVAATLPKVVQVGGLPTILYPGDHAYADALPGDALVDDRPGRRDRLVMDGGTWRTVRSD